MPSYSSLIQPIVDSAVRRGIRVRPLPEMSSSYAILDYRGHREVLCQSFGDGLGTVRFRMLASKAAALRLLHEHKHPAVQWRLVRSLDQARAFLEEHRAMVLEPLDHTGGLGATTGLRRAEDLPAAWEAARDKRGRALATQHLEGVAVRVLAVGTRVFALQREPASVEGDGEASLRALIAAHNDALAVRHHRIPVDEVLEAHLSGKGYTLDTVLPAGAVVPLSELAHTSRGGFCHDVTDLIAPEAVDLARAVAASLGAPQLALELLTPDLVHHAGTIVGLSPHTDITRFHHPTSGKPRDVAGAWLDHLFPGSQGRSA